MLLIKVDFFFFFLRMTTWAKVKQGWLPRHKRCHQEVLSWIVYTFHDYLHFQNFPHIEVKMADQAQKNRNRASISGFVSFLLSQYLEPEFVVLVTLSSAHPVSEYT